jgi:hypothetical protein
MADERYQTELILRAQKLYALVELLRKPEDRATYLKELENVGGLLAYKVPEMSPMSKYLDQARRESVADQINRAILCECFISSHDMCTETFLRSQQPTVCVSSGSCCAI